MEEAEAAKEQLSLEYESAWEISSRKVEAALLAERVVSEVEVARLAQDEAERMFAEAKKKLKTEQHNVESDVAAQIQIVEEERVAEIARLKKEADEAQKAYENELQRRREAQKRLKEIQAKLVDEERE